jgi:tRNA-Thr(GGU) m(6)t(6)A37 methyltransferase TsaA
MIGALSVGAMLMALTAAYAEEPKQTAGEYVFRQIGMVQKDAAHTTLVMNKDVESALLGLDRYSHVLVFWCFDQNDTPEKRAVRQVHPRGNKENPLTGVFACRCPFRPNPLALTLCKIISVKGHVVEIETIDAFDGTPILDLKPYVPGYDSVEGATAPNWRTKEK